MADMIYKNLETPSHAVAAPSPEGRQTGNIKTKRGGTARREGKGEMQRTVGNVDKRHKE